MRAATIKVWDPLVRFGHWALVALFAVAYLGAEDAGRLHIWSGYAIAALVVVRVAWGFVGPRRARFADFLYGPARIARYVKDMIAGQPARFVGHSPAGGVMVVLLLAALAGTTWTGMAQYAQEEGRGPLAPVYATGATPATGGADRVVPGGEAYEAEEHAYEGGGLGGEGEEAEGGEAFEALHETLANLTLGLVAVHIAGVIYAGRVHHENLIRAMFTGRKRAETPGGGDD